MGFFDPKGTAEFSRCGKYRYRLARIWDETLPVCCFVMLNPSTADAYVLDPTIKRCLKRAVRLGCGRLEIVNLFALRATDPQVMLKHMWPVEERRTWRHPNPQAKSNSLAILEAVRASNIVIAAWGVHGQHLDRDLQVVSLLKGYRVMCLGYTKAGDPRHPLMLEDDTPLEPYCPRDGSGPMRCTKRVRLIERNEDGEERDGGGQGPAAGRGPMRAGLWLKRLGD